MNADRSDARARRVLWLGYNTHDEAVAKGVFNPDAPWTYEATLNPAGSFAKVVYAVPFGKRDESRALTEAVAYRERGRLFPALPKAVRFFLELPAAVRFLHRTNRDARPEVLIVCGPHIASMMVWMVPGFWRVPKLCFIEAFWETLPAKRGGQSLAARWLLRIWYRFVYRIFDGYRGAPSLDPSYYIERGMRGDRIYPWVQPIDLDALADIDAADSPADVRSAARPRIVSVGRLHDEKLSLHALEAFIILARQGFMGSLVLVGDGPLRREIEIRAAQAGYTDRVRITGLLPLPKAYASVKACDLYFATMQGAALLEAMAAGIPIVAYDNETHRAMLVDGKTALLTVNGDVAAAATALAALAGDPGRATRLGEAAREEVARRFSPAQVARILVEPINAVRRRKERARNDR